MWVQFPTDSTGRPVTKELAVTIDGERVEVTPTETGAAQVSAAVGEYLLRNTTVTEHESGDPDDADA